MDIETLDQVFSKSPESKTTPPQNESQIIALCMKAETQGNILWPQMYGPKAILLGETFLKYFLAGKITYKTFSESSKNTQADTDEKQVAKIHSTYGRPTNSLVPGQVPLVYSDSKKLFMAAMRDLFGSYYISEFENEKNFSPRIKSAHRLFEAASGCLQTREMKLLSKNYKTAFIPYLSKGIEKMNKLEIKKMLAELDLASQRVQDAIFDSITSENNRLEVPFGFEATAGFLGELAISGSRVANRKNYARFEV